MKLAPRPPALVISGINDGFNLGSDVFYSGTVAAAVEGGLRGVTAIAVSLEPSRPEALDSAVAFTVSLTRAVLAAELPRGTVLNVNVPVGAAGRYRWTRLGKRHYEDDVHCREDPRGRAYYWIGGGVAGIEEMAGSDCEAVSRQITAVTPLRLDLTAHDMLGDRAPALAIDGFTSQP
jgi:5'-nucleotidase